MAAAPLEHLVEEQRLRSQLGGGEAGLLPQNGREAPGLLLPIEGGKAEQLPPEAVEILERPPAIDAPELAGEREQELVEGRPA